MGFASLNPSYKLRTAFLVDRDPPRSRTGLADDPIAALANAPGAATALAGLLDDRRGAVVVHGKSFAENHSDIPCFAQFLKVSATLSTTP
jgi:hypothetical protein